ncbi:hypothetical protein Acsp05_62820 [Actinokineospora sp. NBRC 105648]|nr:hypothetical protein Acsp05_62820 [Actinokineospora sp. NBRC 105648]
MISLSVLPCCRAAVLPCWSLAKGFLTGKYRDGGAAVDSPRAGAASAYLDDRGRRVLLPCWPSHRAVEPG